jgi:hypothetical protein
MRLRAPLLLTALLLTIALPACSNRTPITTAQDYGDYFTLSAVKGDLLVLTAKTNTVENTAILNTAARAKAAWFGKTMGFTSFQVVDETSAEFNTMNLTVFGSQLNNEPRSSPIDEAKAAVGSLLPTKKEYWYNYELDTPERHTSSWGGSALPAEEGHRYRLVVRFFRGNSSSRLANVYDIDELLQAHRFYTRRGAYNRSGIEQIERR